jgi:hypothetical protein
MQVAKGQGTSEVAMPHNVQISIYVAHIVQGMTCAASAGCPTMGAQQRGNTQEMTARWCGACARMPSTCSA